MITWSYKLRAGHSDDPSHGACAADAVNWLVHGKHGDAPECACRVILPYLIRGNDTMPDDTRERLKPYLHRIAGSRSPEHESARLRILVLAASRIFAANAVERVGLSDVAESLRSIPSDASYAAIEGVAEAAVARVAQIKRVKWVAGWAAETARTAAEAAWRSAEAVAAVTWAEAETVQAVAARAAQVAALAATEAEARAARAAHVAARAAAEAQDRSVQLAAHVAARAATAWDDYFAVLDAVLNAGPQGEPWSADVIAFGDRLFVAAGGVAELA
jgi:hypothetical protein